MGRVGEWGEELGRYEEMARSSAQRNPGKQIVATEHRARKQGAACVYSSTTPIDTGGGTVGSLVYWRPEMR